MFVGIVVVYGEIGDILLPLYICGILYAMICALSQLILISFLLTHTYIMIYQLYDIIKCDPR